MQAHAGAAAATATRELRAKAYAFGNAVAFDGSPDLHTAAHEAAHVVQQRGGVQLKGGIDRPGDDYERHADAVADAVVAGEPAEHLLDQVAVGSGSTAAAVQRKTDEAVQPSHAKQLRTIERYLAAHQLRIWRLIGERAQSVAFPDPAPRLSWTRQRMFVRELLMQLEANISDFTPLAKLDEILHPSDAVRTVGALLPAKDVWSPPLGLAIAQTLQIAIVSSLHRLGPRYLAIADSTGTAGEGVVSANALVFSMPIDRYVGAAMCAPRTLTIEPPDARAAAKPKGKPGALRPVKLAWEGAQDPHLWNWVRATEPADATVEEVAAALWTVTDHHGEANAAFNAYLLAAAPPLFGIPKKFAIKNPKAKQHAPVDALRGEDSVDTELIDIATSSAGDGIALHQSPAPPPKSPNGKATPFELPPDISAVIGMLGDCNLQLAFVTSEVARWGFADRVAPAISFVKHKQSEFLTSDGRTLSAWNRVIVGQRDRLFKISGMIHNLASTAGKLGIKDPKAPEAAPVREILEVLAVAAGTSPFAQTSEAKLQQALALQSGLDVRAIQAVERDLASAHLDFSTAMGPKSAKGIAGFSHEVVGLQQQSRQLQTTMINGGEVNTAEIDEVTLRSGEIALRERMLGTIHSTFELQAAAMNAKEGIAAHIATLFSGKFRNLAGLCQHIRDRIAPIQNEMIVTAQQIRAEEQSRAGTPELKARCRGTRRAVLAKAQAEFAKISHDEDLQNFFLEGTRIIQNQQFRTACVNAAALIGIAVLAAATGGVAAELAGGMLVGAEGVATVAELSTVARLGVTAANVVVDSAVNAVGQRVVQGGSLRQAFVENLFMSFASTALFGTIARASAETARLEGREAMTWAKAGTFAQKAMIVGKEAGAVTVHTVWGAAIGYVARRVVSGHEPSPMQARDWLLQGASVAIGRRIHKALGERVPGLERLAKRSAEAKRLVVEAKQLQQLATAVEESKKATSAVELLDQRTKLLRDEIEVIEKVVAKDGDASGELGKARKDLEGQLHESNTEAMLETKFHLLGLEELVPGALWKGSHEQIQRAVEEARRSGAKASQDAHTRRWRVALEGRTIEVQEVASDNRAHERTGEKRRADEQPAESAPTAQSEKAQIVLAGTDAELADVARAVHPLPDAIDVFVHGTVDDLTVEIGGQEIHIDHRALAKYIQKSGQKIHKVRLLSCKTGQHPKGVGQHLANKLGVTVIAPSDILWIREDGTLIIGPRQDRNTGRWLEFAPSKSSSRYTKSLKPTTPERAIDRYHDRTAFKLGGKDEPHPSHSTSAGEWVDHLEAQLTPAEREKFQQIRGRRTPEEVQNQFGGDVDKALAMVRKAAAESADAAHLKEASQRRAAQIHEWAKTHGVMNSAKLQQALSRLPATPQPKDIAKIVSDVRSEIIGQLRAQELANEYPGALVLRDVRVWAEDGMTPEQFNKSSEAERQGRTRNRDADGRERIYKDITDIDVLVLDKPLTPGGKSRMLRLDQEKTGQHDAPAMANAQNENATKAIIEDVNGRRRVLLRIGKTDITDQIDLRSIITADKKSVGPAGKGFEQSLGITSGDLERLVRMLVAETKDPI